MTIQSIKKSSKQDTPSAGKRKRAADFRFSVSDKHRAVTAEPVSWDVLCNRSRFAFNHIGNRRFRLAIANHALAYSKLSTKSQKSTMVLALVKSVQDAGGNFLSRNKHGRWEQVSTLQAKEKVGHAFRAAVARMSKDEPHNIYNIIGSAPTTKQNSSKSPTTKINCNAGNNAGNVVPAETIGDASREPSSQSPLRKSLVDAIAEDVLSSLQVSCEETIMQEIEAEMIIIKSMLPEMTRATSGLVSDLMQMDLPNVVSDDESSSSTSDA